MPNSNSRAKISSAPGPVPASSAKNRKPSTTRSVAQDVPPMVSIMSVYVSDSTNTRGSSGLASPRKGIVPSPSTIPTNSQNGRSSRYPRIPNCQIPGCSDRVYIDPDGVASKYCSEQHWKLGTRGCIYCREEATDGTIVFCSSCYRGLQDEAPTIVRVPRDHERYISVVSQFRRTWLHNDRCPEVRAVYKIVSGKANMRAYEQYRDKVETKSGFSLRNKMPGNENRRWHGTTRRCNIGDNGQTEFCSSSRCSLCCIMKTSFDISFFAKKTNFGRFGEGIYTSSTSSKSDSYSHNKCTSDWKALLLNNVVVGRGCRMTTDDTSLTAPPAGYDSVLAEVGPRLNYDELVVYHNDAIRPSYLVMYDTPE